MKTTTELGNPLTTEPTKTDKTDKTDRYFFYVETEQDEVVWSGLTLKQARDMNAWTDRACPRNVKTYGWELIK